MTIALAFLTGLGAGAVLAALLADVAACLARALEES